LIIIYISKELYFLFFRYFQSETKRHYFFETWKSIRFSVCELETMISIDP